MSEDRNHERSVAELFDLRGRTILITGGTGWLGSAFSRACAEMGGRIVIASRSRDRAVEAAARLPADGAHLGVELDHLDQASIERGFEEVVSATGAIDVLVNNGNQAQAKDLTEVTGEEFTQQLANATGFFLLARRFRDHVVARRVPGSIIMLGSMYGQVASYPDAYAGITSASPVGYHCLKGGVIHMTRHLAIYWARDRVRVNCLSPGPFPKPDADDEMVRRLASKSPMQRMGLPEELKGAAVFLASDASSYMTGQNLTIDGGWTAW